MVQLLSGLPMEVNSELTKHEETLYCVSFLESYPSRCDKDKSESRICPCTETKIRTLFPRLPGKERVGFRSYNLVFMFLRLNCLAVNIFNLLHCIAFKLEI